MTTETTRWVITSFVNGFMGIWNKACYSISKSVSKLTMHKFRKQAMASNKTTRNSK